MQRRGLMSLRSTTRCPFLHHAALSTTTTTSRLRPAADVLVKQVHHRQKETGIPIQPRDISFGGCGFLLSYHVGIAHSLRELGYLQASSRVAGASGGAIIAAAVASDIDLNLIHEDAKTMAAAGRTMGTWGKVEPGLREIFKYRFADVDIDTLSQSRRLTIATQQVWPKQQLVYTDQFHSKEDLCDALIASCFIPFYLARQGASKFRGELHVDGGLIKLVPELPDYVRVSALHSTLLRRPDYELSPSLDSDFPISFWDLARYSLFPAEAHTLDDLFELGRKSAALWADAQLKQ